MQVYLVGATRWEAGAEDDILGGEWAPDYDHDGDSEILAEFAGRACYQSWNRPNPETATNEGYLANILGHQHFSVLEHAGASFYVTGVSRSLTHELVRHRHLSFSQLSQRYVDMVEADYIVPPLFRGDTEAETYLRVAWEHDQWCYEQLATRAHKLLVEQGVTGHAARKEARQAARAVLGNMAETKLVVSGNHAAWREVIRKRISPLADAEIQEFAALVLRELRTLAPNIYQDFPRKEGE